MSPARIIGWSIAGIIGAGCVIAACCALLFIYGMLGTFAN